MNIKVGLRVGLVFLGLSILAAKGAASEKKDVSLEQELKAKAEESARQMPADKLKIMNDAIQALGKEKILEKVPKVGETFPDFSLLNVKGKVVKRAEVIKSKRTVITFYRGGWCPYCSIQLHALQKELPRIKALGADLIAISPELPDNSMTTQQKNKLDFLVLSDADQKLARQLGIVYALPESLQKVYTQFKIDLPTVNGQKTWELPLAATFVVDGSNKILYAFAHEDYKVRAPMQDVLKALE